MLGVVRLYFRRSEGISIRAGREEMKLGAKQFVAKGINREGGEKRCINMSQNRRNVSKQSATFAHEPAAKAGAVQSQAGHARETNVLWGCESRQAMNDNAKSGKG